ncbi:MAG: hypothetical protein WKG52_02565 [Variovorax sp.]
MRWPLLGLVVSLALLVSGCGGGDAPRAGLGSGDARGSHVFDAHAPGAAVCSGADLSGVKAAVHVAPDGVDAAGCGTGAATACKTVQQGIGTCGAPGCAVLVRHGLYPTTATIELRSGVSVYGGCRFAGEADRLYRSTIVANPPPGMPAIAGQGINAPTILQGLVVIAKEETAAGSPSIAMTVSGSRALALTGMVLIAGKGGDGATGSSAPGQPGGSGASPTCTTCRGAAGKACPSNLPAGDIGSGGDGASQNVVYSYQCIGRCRCEPQQVADSLGLVGQGSGNAGGGKGGGFGAYGCSCYLAGASSEVGLENPGPGDTGGPADKGQCSTQGGTASGQIWGAPVAQGAAWLPGSGGVGQTASVGAGGGGGGAGGYATWDGTDRNGLGGGGGGGGGCGGPGGQGGQQGGASLALVLIDSQMPPVVQVNSLVPGPGGRGGTGGQGGVGGPGGSGGPGLVGGQFPFDVRGTCHASFAPASGGPGGRRRWQRWRGGDGGPSVGIALRGTSPTPTGLATIYSGTPGGGGGTGQGGVNPNCTGAPGLPGLPGGSASVVDLDKPPAGAIVTVGTR